MPIDLYKYLIEETDEEITILENKNKLAVNKGLYTNQADFVIESDKFLRKDKMIMVRKHTRYVDFPKHRHDYVEINYVYHGELKQKVGDEFVHLKQGELLLLNQHMEHEITACGKEDIVINFIIQPHFFNYIFSYLSAESDDHNISDFLVNSLFNHTQSGQFLYFAVADLAKIQVLVKEMIQEIMEPSLLSDAKIKFQMGLLLIELMKHSDKIEKSQQHVVEHNIIIDTLQYIEANYVDASLYQLASQLKQPHYALSKKIKKLTDKTFKELIQEKRLQEAKALLLNTDLPITAVVEQVGYDNISYFYRIFKTKYGCTPKKFREQLPK